ncbi:hypothetical protein PV683_14325 [Streptomyces sp. AK08-01B]|nr:hypothetical protein [Streptomyces sp. 136MFCol5.1]MDX3766913.1 hypothetical protein [Streptomyces sp. AK08-01B]MDX3820293.1 hypothetical protein [Streptomyces sp. AK08-01A]
MSRGRKTAIVVVASAGIVSTPLFWLLDKPDTGQLVGASIQGATGIAALLWALFQRSAAPGPDDAALDTGRAKASGGATARTGVKRGNADSGSARAERTGDATASGPGSTASTGIDYS